MREAKGNLWLYPADLRVITTNGYVKNDGSAVMRRGCAKEATYRYPGVEFKLGYMLQKYGNHVYLLYSDLANFPVKHNWWEDADLALIERSTQELVECVDDWGYRDVVVPRPGCGSGHLDWSDVREVIQPHLDERFTVITYD